MAEPPDRLCSRIDSYYRTYHATVNEYGLPVLERLPSFVRGPHRREVLVCKDGVGVVAYLSATMEVACLHFPDRRLDVTMTERAGFMTWDLRSKPFGLHVAGVTLTRISPGDPLVHRPKWDRAYVTSDVSAGKWTSQAARTDAHHDVAAMLTALLMNLPHGQVEEAPKRLQDVLVAFEKLLDREPHEEEVQQFLKDNPVLVDPTALSITSKVRLGTEHVTDFVVEKSEGDYELVEIEPPKERLFTVAGDPTARLSHAQKQVEDWREWVSENISYARKTMPGITEPRGRVIMGRRSQLTPQTGRALQRRNQELRHIIVETFDDLVSRVRRTIQNIS